METVTENKVEHGRQLIREMEASAEEAKKSLVELKKTIVAGAKVLLACSDLLGDDLVEDLKDCCKLYERDLQELADPQETPEEETGNDEPSKEVEYVLPHVEKYLNRFVPSLRKEALTILLSRQPEVEREYECEVARDAVKDECLNYLSQLERPHQLEIYQRFLDVLKNNNNGERISA